MKNQEICLCRDAFGQRPADMAQENGHDHIVAMLQVPVDDRQKLVDKWSWVMLAQLPVSDGKEAAGLSLSPPVLRRVRSNDLELRCDIVDLEFRIMEYVVEVHRCSGPCAAAPARL